MKGHRFVLRQQVSREVFLYQEASYLSVYLLRLFISRFRLIHSLLLDKMWLFFLFFLGAYPQINGEKSVLYKKKKRCTTVTDWRKLNHAAACVPL